MAKLKLIDGNGSRVEQRKADKKKFLMDRYLLVMEESKDITKVIHAGVRWFAMRERWGNGDPAVEYLLYNKLLDAIAEYFSPKWIAREFPAEKEYTGHKWQCKDYFSCMEVLRAASPFNGDSRKVLRFMWEWYNCTVNQFTIAGITIIDELRAMQGECSCMAAFARENGIATYHTTKTRDGKEILLDDGGRIVGRVRKPIPRYLKKVN